MFPSPKVKLLFESTPAVSDALPIQVLLLPVVVESPASQPIKVLLSPVVTASPASLPTAVFLSPLVEAV